MSASSLNESHHDPPTRTKSEGDTIDSLSQDNHSQRRPTIPHVNSFTFGQKKKKFFGGRNTKKQWMFAAQKAKSLRDPWGGLGMESLAEEVVTRHMYNPRSKKWKVDEIVVKIQSESFAHGAMRECYRMKKLSKFSQRPDWYNASNNVAKRYMKEVPKDTYFEDVKLQMDSKLWGELYNKIDVVPKKVDFFQTYIIEFRGREGSPLYGVEHFIEGGYVKYNSNSGFVSDVNRLTPQAFSHFTFEKSKHWLILVDIQGVGDLYTDPQMHTVDQKEYGEANLGVRGMALYFSSHICSPLCKALGLTQFDLSEKEMDNLLSKRWSFSSSTTKVSSLASSGSGGKVQVNESKLEVPGSNVDDSQKKETVGQAFRRLSASINVESLKNTKRPDALMDLGSIPESPLPLDSPYPLDTPLIFGGIAPISEEENDIKNGGGILIKVPHSELEDASQSSADSGDEECFDSCYVGNENELETCPIDIEPDGDANADDRYSDSLESSNCGSSSKLDKEESEDSNKGCLHVQVPDILHSSSVEKERTRLNEGECGALGTNETNALKILGEIHLDLSRCHESGRFSNEQMPIDYDIIKFHLDRAASCGNTLALYTLAHIYLQLPHEDFSDISVEPSPEHESEGMDYLLGAAERGLIPAMFEVAKAYDSGVGLGIPTSGDPDKHRTQNWSEAVSWYHKVLQPEANNSNISTDTMAQVDPDYLLLSRLAELYRSGGNGLVKDPQKAGDLYTEAAEAAMNAMKGKLSNKYFMLAEEAWGEMEED